MGSLGDSKEPWSSKNATDLLRSFAEYTLSHAVSAARTPSAAVSAVCADATVPTARTISPIMIRCSNFMAEPTVDADYRLYRHPTTSKGEAAQLPAHSAPVSLAGSRPDAPRARRP